jgi:hypothetical protein
MAKALRWSALWRDKWALVDELRSETARLQAENTRLQAIIAWIEEQEPGISAEALCALADRKEGEHG